VWVLGGGGWGRQAGLCADTRLVKWAQAAQVHPWCGADSEGRTPEQHAAVHKACCHVLGLSAANSVLFGCGCCLGAGSRKDFFFWRYTYVSADGAQTCPCAHTSSGQDSTAQHSGLGLLSLAGPQAAAAAGAIHMRFG
jgi:hypothetical protein